MELIALIIGVLALLAGIRHLRRRKAMRSLHGAGLSDEMIRRIEEEGRIDAEEPLDLEHIEEEEERFWEESWDEPEEY